MDFFYSIVVFFIVASLVFSWFVFDLLYGEQSASYKTRNLGVSTAEPPDEQGVAIQDQSATLIKREVTPPKRRRPTCRDEVVAAARMLTREKGVDEFTAKEIVDFLIAQGSEYSTGTIRNHVASRCCVNSGGDQNGYGDFMRVVRGRYRLAIG